MQMYSPSRQTGPDFLPPLCDTSESLNAFNGLTNEYLCPCLSNGNQFVSSHKRDVNCEMFCHGRAGLDEDCEHGSRMGCYLTRHSRSLAGREMMMRSFFANSVTKATSELSERSKAWQRETHRQTGRQKERRLTFLFDTVKSYTTLIYGHSIRPKDRQSDESLKKALTFEKMWSWKTQLIQSNPNQATQSNHSDLIKPPKWGWWWNCLIPVICSEHN